MVCGECLVLATPCRQNHPLLSLYCNQQLATKLKLCLLEKLLVWRNRGCFHLMAKKDRCHDQLKIITLYWARFVSKPATTTVQNVANLNLAPVDRHLDRTLSAAIQAPDSLHYDRLPQMTVEVILIEIYSTLQLDF